MGLSKRWLFAVLAMALGVALLPMPASASGPGFTTVATGLDSPRGVAFHNGVLLVAEAGHGGTACFMEPAAGEVCIGNSGRISSIKSGTRATLVDGLFSETARGGFDVEGPAGLSVEEGRILAQISTPPQEVPNPPTISASASAFGKSQAGRLIQVRPSGKWRTLAKVGEFDFHYTLQFSETGAAAQEHDSNPYGILSTEEGAYVADAGSNTLDRVGPDGRVTVLLHDPFLTIGFPHDAVPTCVVKTEDGLLVGELSGRVLKVHGSTFTVIHNSLFTHITGCTSDRHGNVYFVNMFGSGAPFAPPTSSNFFIGNVVKYNPETGGASLLAAAPFLLPNMDTIGPDGNLYVSVRSICPTFPGCNGATGGVIKINL